VNQPVIIAGVRTPIGVMGGIMRDLPAQELGRLVTVELLERTKIDPALIEEVTFGCAGQGSDAPNVARVIGLRAGIPVSTPGMTVHRNCASGIQAVVTAAQNIKCDDADVQIAGGAESMSGIPYINRDMRYGKRLQHSVFIDSLWEGLTDPVCNQLMGATAENLVEEFGISREDQDKYAVESHKKAFRAQRMGKFDEEIMTVMVPKKMAGREVAPEPFSKDEGVNPAITVQTLAMYPTVFKRDGGSVTPGNSCPLNDAAAALLVMSDRRAAALGYTPLASIRAYAFAGVEPERMGIGPVKAIPKALQKAGLKLSDIDLFEINEAFAAQYLAVERVLELNRNKVNVNGGAIALGHPIGATGARLIISLAYEMKRSNARYGVAALCVGGGQGGAIVLEREQD
jgi:acetyl-CoA C-acetyltransferase